MPGWVPFLGLAAVLTLAVLFLTRRTSALLDESLPNDGATVEDAAVAPEPPTAPDTKARPHRSSASRPALADLSWRALLANVVATQGILGVVVLVAVVYFAIPQPAVGLGDGRWVWGLDALALGLGLGVALWIASEVAGRLADVAGVSYDERLRELLAPETPAGWLALFFGALPIVAVAEELLFRAALVGVPAAWSGLSPWLFVALSAAAFALAHGAQGRVGIVATGIMGLVLGGAFVLTESLVVVAFAHYVVNALEFGVYELFGDRVWGF